MHILTKSKYIRGLQCEKALYLDVYQPKLARYSAETLAKFRGGRDFEHTFKETFPEGIDVSARLRWQMDMYPTFTTQQLQQEGKVVLFEAGFLYDDVLVLADVVCKQPDGSVDFYEVKNSQQVSETFRRDVAVQRYVVEHAFEELPLRLNSFNVVYNNGEGGFCYEDLLTEAREQEECIAANVARFKEMLQGFEPQIAMGDHCNNPYECPYNHYCRRLIANTSVGFEEKSAK